MNMSAHSLKIKHFDLCKLGSSVELVKILRHFFNLSIEMFLDLLDEAGVLGWNEVNGGTFTTISSGTTNTMDIVFLLERELVIDN
jgi:hypothetical protein